MRGARRGLSLREQAEAERALGMQIAGFEPYKNARSVMAYVAVRGEISLAPVIGDVLARGKTLLLPRCESQGIMTAREICSMDDLEPGAYGLPEPKKDCPICEPERIDLIFVPGVAFDRAGGRLGQGGGYYDRFLRRSGALRVGVCHGFALLEAVPCEAHDEQMDHVIIPGGIVRTGSHTRYDRRT